MKAKVLVLDIETAPLRSWTWGLWKQNVGLNQIDRDWFVLSWAAKWLHEDEVFSDAMNLYPDYQPGSEDDEKVITSAWDYLDETDILIGHNAKAFDAKKLNARFLKYGLPPPSPYKVIDTLLIAKKAFNLPSNKLDAIAALLKVNVKQQHEGFSLWDKCMKGDPEGWKNMIAYNEQDIRVTEDVFMALRPWDTQSPNLSLYEDHPGDEKLCPTCGGTHIHKRGTYKTNVNVFQRYQCQDCKSWFRGRYAEKRTKEQRENILTNTA